MSLLKKIGPWIISAALCLLAAEILGAALFYRSSRSLIYFNQPKVATAAPAPELTYKRHLHPYFGYTGPYSTRGARGTPTNNLGFVDIQQREVPFEPGPNDFLVFVFGSSVASKLLNNSMYGHPSLQEALQKLPQLAGKNVVLYNMAQGPGKQPQQLMELAFLIASGQHIDLVLNLDGALEFVEGLYNFENGIDPIFPPAEILLAIGKQFAAPDTTSADYYELAYTVTHARAESQRYASLLGNSTSGIAYLKNRIFLAVYDRILNGKLAAYNQTIAKATGDDAVRKRLGLNMSMRATKESVVKDIFDMWVRCSDLMKVMANSAGATYLNVVLPNPYYSKKVLSESEKAVLYDPQVKRFRQDSSGGYAFIESHAETLKSRGIVLASTIFDDIPESIYVDSSGHLGKLGEAILAKFVGDQTSLKLGSPPAK